MERLSTGLNLFEKYSFKILSFSLLAFSFLAFSSEIKEQVRKEQKNICAVCGKKVKKLQIHHRIPQSLGGEDTRRNAIGLCSSCHQEADRLAFKFGKYP